MKRNKGKIIFILIVVFCLLGMLGSIEKGEINTEALISSFVLLAISSAVYMNSKRRKRIKESQKEHCAVCGNTPSKFPISDGRICSDCFKEFKDMPNFITRVTKITRTELLSYRKEQEYSKEQNSLFNATKRIGSYIEFDKDRGQFRLMPMLGAVKKTPDVYNCEDIIEYELLEDGISVTSGGLGRAAAGGILFGGVGAIVGGVTGKKKTRSEIENFKIKLTLNNFQSPTVYIELLNKKKIKTNSNKYKEMYEKAQEILSTLAVLQNNKEESNSVKDNKPTTDRIREYKALFDDGIITEDEFNAKKKELLEI